MFRITERNSNKIAAVLMIYIFGVLYFVSFKNNGNNIEVNNLETEKGHSEEFEKPTLTSSIEIPLARKREILESLDKKTNLSNDYEHHYEHPLHPVFPLSGAITNPHPILKLGNIEQGANVVIGITTIKRPDDVTYIFETVQSLLEKMGAGRSDDTRIVVFIGETDQEFIKQISLEFFKRFPGQITDGLLEVISPPFNYYPDWNSVLPESFGDTIERIKWRSKQNLDQVFLMMYIYNLSPNFYLMMEDDVTATNDYMNKILKKIKRYEKRDWFYISFCSLGAIGKLFHARTLPPYASFIHTFWNRKPLDWLQIDYVNTAYCSFDENLQKCVARRKEKMIGSTPALFQHNGKISSLAGKEQLLKDRSFKKL